MRPATTNPKLTCPRCKQKLRFKKQLREGAKCKCPKCNGYFVFATNGPNAETETYEYESEIRDFEILASEFDLPKPMGQ
jgi:transcription initiation factor IIE alpha subunit